MIKYDFYLHRTSYNIILHQFFFFFFFFFFFLRDFIFKKTLFEKPQHLKQEQLTLHQLTLLSLLFYAEHLHQLAANNSKKRDIRALWEEFLPGRGYIKGLSRHGPHSARKHGQRSVTQADREHELPGQHGAVAIIKEYCCVSIYLFTSFIYLFHQVK